jgi:hypothetical protein
MGSQGVAAAVVLRVKADGSRSYKPVATFDAILAKFVPVLIDLWEETDQVYLIPFGTGVRNRSNLNETTAIFGASNMQVLYAGEEGTFVGAP